jgi:hypothetical protein
LIGLSVEAAKVRCCRVTLLTAVAVLIIPFGLQTRGATGGWDASAIVGVRLQLRLIPSLFEKPDQAINRVSGFLRS